MTVDGFGEGTGNERLVIGEPFQSIELIEAPAADVLADVGRYLAVIQDPPWVAERPHLPAPAASIAVAGMEESVLADMARSVPDELDTIVGFGGGAALDTAKYLAWKSGVALIQIPTITSVDAAFTDAIGVRSNGRVRYVGNVLPKLVVIDVEMIRRAPKSLNRAGVGDVLSCHTGLFDWSLSVATDTTYPWREDLAALGRRVLFELDACAPDIANVTADGVRFLADAYRRIGAACAHANHSRFEEGSEHFWAYTYEHMTARHQAHGELIALGVVAMSVLQGNEPGWVVDLLARCEMRAHPLDLAIDESTFVATLIAAPDYARRERLDVSILDYVEINTTRAAEVWREVCRLPRVDPATRS